LYKHLPFTNIVYYRQRKCFCAFLGSSLCSLWYYKS